MDTPEKVPIGTPVSNFEESPFSSFINSLSPITQSKPMNMSQTIGSLNFTSPPSVFTSPQVCLQRESRFQRRHQLAELSKLDLSSENKNKDSTMEDGGKGASSSTITIDEAKEEEPSKDEYSYHTQRGVSDLNVELPTELKYDCSSPTLQTEPGTSSYVPLPKEACGKDSCGMGSSGTDINMHGTGCDWDNMISDATDVLALESSQDTEALNNSTEQLVDEQIDLLSLLSTFPDNDVSDMEEQCDTSKDEVTHPAEATEMKQIYQKQDNNGSSSSGSFSVQTSKKLENKPFMQHGIRRRCLVFEISGAKKNADGSLISSSIYQDEVNLLPNNSKHSTVIRSGIGLHLNSLAVASKRQMVLEPENCSSEKQLLPVPKSSESFPSLSLGSESFKTSVSITSEDNDIGENKLLNAGDASQASTAGDDDDLILNSPKKKRPRPENTGEGESSCKRCNCKKSKCLKLYCECFAAGLYCVEPCACQDCFNKPVHEETVLATRKQIESRNPLAFAPKVVKSTNSANDFHDDSNRTPASARHKRGCNCKKSSCLKKYCECYQGGVGCSIGCRCEGCKNTFGKRDVSSAIRMELDVEQDTPVHDNCSEDKIFMQPRTDNDEDLNPGSALPKTPLRLFRSSLNLASSSKDKPPFLFGSSLLSRDHGPGRSTFLRTQHKTDKQPPSEASGEEMPVALQNASSPSSSGVKTLSPNSKRISPPHHGNSSGPVRSNRKLILQSIPSFPSLTPRH